MCTYIYIYIYIYILYIYIYICITVTQTPTGLRATPHTVDARASRMNVWYGGPHHPLACSPPHLAPAPISCPSYASKGVHWPTRWQGHGDNAAHVSSDLV